MWLSQWLSQTFDRGQSKYSLIYTIRDLNWENLTKKGNQKFWLYATGYVNKFSGLDTVQKWSPQCMPKPTWQITGKCPRSWPRILFWHWYFRQPLLHFGKPPYDLKFPADKFWLLKCWQKGTDVNNWTWKNKQTCPVQINIDGIRSRPTQYCYISIFCILALKSGLGFKLGFKKLAMTPSLNQK